MVVSQTITIELMKAYFEGGNAKEKAPELIKEDLKVIKEIVEKEDKKED